MSMRKKIANSAEVSKGRMKRAYGRATRNRRLGAEGLAGQIKGNLKQSGAKLKDAFKK